MAAKGNKAAARHAYVYRVTAAEGAKISTRHMRHRLTDTDFVLRFSRTTNGYIYAPIDHNSTDIALYPKAYRFDAPVIGTPSQWQPNEDEVHVLWGMQWLGADGARHPLIAEMEQARMEVEEPAREKAMMEWQDELDKEAKAEEQAHHGYRSGSVGPMSVEG